MSLIPLSAHPTPKLGVVRTSGARRKAPPGRPDRRPDCPRREARIPAAARARLDPTAYRVLVACDRLRRGEEASIAVTDQEIGRRCQRGTAAVQRALRACERAGYLRRVRKRGVRRICFSYSPAGREARPKKGARTINALIVDRPSTNPQPPSPNPHARRPR